MNGITLIALVVTIIILLILAGVTISLVIGNNGIIKQANIAKVRQQEASVQEQIELAKADLLVEQKQINTDNIIDQLIKVGYINAIEDVKIRVSQDGIVYLTVKDIEIAMGKATGNEPLIDDTLPENKMLQSFITRWKVGENDTIVLPIIKDDPITEEIENYQFNFVVDYGDGSAPVTVTSETDENRKHTYAVAGEYEVKITGVCEKFSFQNIVESKDKIIGIKQWGAIGLKHINFLGCSNLVEQIPSPTKNSFVNIERFTGLFTNCNQLQGTIPANLFRNAPKVTEMGWIFSGCSNLEIETIDEKLFSNLPEVTSFQAAFTSTKLKIIPEKLFVNNEKVTNFRQVFQETAIETVPERIFANNKIATNFMYVFYNCKQLKRIDYDIFQNNTVADNFEQGFEGCTSLEFIPEDLFSKIVVEVKINYTFNNCINLSSKVPKLWNNEKIGGYRCFKGCTKIANYAEIPDLWK